MLVQVTRDKIFFSDLQNSFLDFAASLGFVNLFGIYKKIFIFISGSMMKIAILKHKEVVRMTRKMSFTFFKYLFSFKFLKYAN